MKKVFATRNLDISVDAVLLIIRLVMGYAFINFGLGKIQNPFQWMGPDSAVPGIFQFLAALSEFGGGIALVLGLLTRLASFGLACTMMGAVIMHKFVMGDPFINLTGGSNYQPAALYLLLSLLFLAAGPGRFALDRKLFGVRG